MGHLVEGIVGWVKDNFIGFMNRMEVEDYNYNSIHKLWQDIMSNFFVRREIQYKIS